MQGFLAYLLVSFDCFESIEEVNICKALFFGILSGHMANTAILEKWADLDPW